ncbi:MAG: hypothetical protein ABJN42_24770 [Roseibium sp.]|uniref:hypothetical protein n=1 Tax=Roseibium sp. TaxID=1936156 RepID=UPI003298A625
MFQPKFITFTGADDRTSIAEMAALAEDHEVEFAILFSESRSDSARYPSYDWIEEVRDSGLRLAAHICGSWAREIATAGTCDIDHRMKGFSRVQINTGPGADVTKVKDWANRASDKAGHEVTPILQCREAFPEDDRVAWLYDCSGGRGTLPDSWPLPPQKSNVLFGYAGGMGPDNVAGILASLEGNADSWIDMESRVRNDQELFDLEMCRDVCISVANACRLEGSDPQAL